MPASRTRIHYGWIVLGAVVLIMLTASGLRAVLGVFIKPLEAEFGWDRASLSGAAAAQPPAPRRHRPFVGWLADRWGPKRVMRPLPRAARRGRDPRLRGCTVALAALRHRGRAAGARRGRHGHGDGGHHRRPLVRGAPRPRPRHPRRGHVGGTARRHPARGLADPHFGWRSSFLWLGISVFFTAIPIALIFVRDNPAEKGLDGLRREAAARAPGTTAPPAERRVALGEAMGYPAFWLLAGTFFVCGYTSNGMVLTHLVPHAAEHGFSEMHAAQALGVMGAMNIVGTVLSGWICDRFGRKGPLAFYYGVRGLSLLFLLYVWNVPSLHLFAAIFGLNYISTVPPTTTLTANIFGRYSVGTLSGWIFFSHQVGSALGAAAGGWIFDLTGSLLLGVHLLRGARLHRLRRSPSPSRKSPWRRRPRRAPRPRGPRPRRLTPC